jgi:hypothetical protein
MQQAVIDAVALELERRGIEGVANEGRPGGDELGPTSGLSIYNVDIRSDGNYLVGIAWEDGEPYFTFASNVSSSSDDVECIADWIVSVCEYLGTDDYQRAVLSGENSLSYCPPPPRPTLEGRAKRSAQSSDVADAFKFPRDRGASEGTSSQEPFSSERRSEGSVWSGSYLPRTTAIPVFDFSELPVDGIRFEQLIRELLLKSGFEVHWTGVGPDNRRDLVLTERAIGPFSQFERRWLVSCKHFANSGKSVGMEAVSSIIDDCAAVNAEGFLLVCSTHPSSSVVNRLQELRSSGRLATAIWDAIEIEKRLRTFPTLTLVQIFLPKTARSLEWTIFASATPSLWAAFFKGYFFYLACRDAHLFRPLAEVEQIVQALEQVACDAGVDSLRPRAIYLDDKNSNYLVFVDKLVGDDKNTEAYGYELMRKLQFTAHVDWRIRDPEDKLELTDDILQMVDWDLRIVRADFASDHFDPDHQSYYEPYMENFRFGSRRD